MKKEEKDLRFQRTKKSIIAAMTKLLEKKNFDQITVKDICEKAYISRSGFYLHYKDKYDLVESYQKEMLEKGTGIFERTLQRGEENFLLEVLQFLNGEGKMFALLISDHGSPEIQRLMMEMLQKNARQNILPNIQIQVESEVEEKYLVAFMSNANLGVVKEWISSGQRESPEEVAEIMNKILPFNKR